MPRAPRTGTSTEAVPPKRRRRKATPGPAGEGGGPPPKQTEIDELAERRETQRAAAFGKLADVKAAVTVMNDDGHGIKQEVFEARIPFVPAGVDVPDSNGLGAVESAKRAVAAMNAAATQGERDRGTPEDDQAADPAFEFYTPPGEEAGAGRHTLYDHIPADTAYGDDSEAIEDNGHLRHIGLWLTRNRPELAHLQKRVLLFFWHREGGTPSGKPAIEGATRMRGYARAAYEQLNGEEPDWAIWLAADHLRKVRPTVRQIEAALYHALRHAQETSKGKPTTAPHEFEGFTSELSIYGAWNRELLDLLGALDRKPAADVTQTELGLEYQVDGAGIVVVTKDDVNSFSVGVLPYDEADAAGREYVREVDGAIEGETSE